MAWIGIHLCFVADAFNSDLWTAWPQLLDFAFPIYLGYSIYDMGTMYFQKQHWTMWLHHILVRFSMIQELFYFYRLILKI
jgi:hypothetical protein